MLTEYNGVSPRSSQNVVSFFGGSPMLTEYNGVSPRSSQNVVSFF